jgi:cytidine deaminase
MKWLWILGATIVTVMVLLLLVINKPKPMVCTKQGQSKSFSALDYKELESWQQQLIDKAEAVMANSYNPYSKFAVGAAVLTSDGEIIVGTNFENASYGTTICAERAAIIRANSEGKRKIKAIAIIGRGKDFETTEPVAPCGSCRQVIYEASQIANNDVMVIMSNSKKDKIIVSWISELLPLAFGPKDLGIVL